MDPNEDAIQIADRVDASCVACFRAWEKGRETPDALRSAMTRDTIFVFFTNVDGQHLSDSARVALEQYDAQWGVGEGRTGMAYALPTHDHQLRPLPAGEQQIAILHLVQYMDTHPQYRYVFETDSDDIPGFIGLIRQALRNHAREREAHALRRTPTHLTPASP